MDFAGKNNPNWKGGVRSHSAWNAWSRMKDRCCNPNNPKYHRYGGRGIKVCQEWLHNSAAFCSWADASGYKKGMSLDRIDNNGGYSPDNCRWVSVSENSRKKKTTKLTLEQAQEIRARAKEGAAVLATEYNCTEGNIWFILHNYTHVPEGMCAEKLKMRRQKNNL